MKFLTMKKFKKFVVAAVVLVIVFALSACGNDAYADYVGNYVAVKGEMAGFSITGDELNDFSIELKKGGKGTIKVSGESGNIKYTIAGTTISIIADGEEIIGTIANDAIVVENMLGLGMDLTFGKEGTDAAKAETYENGSIDISDLAEADTETETEEEPQSTANPADPTTVWGVWKGTVKYTDSWGQGMFDTEQEVAGYADYGAETGVPFFWLYLQGHPDRPFVQIKIQGSREEESLNTFTFTPDIGEDDSWISNRYLTHDDAWYFTGVNVEGKMNFEYDFESPDGAFGCHVSIDLEKDIEASATADSSEDSSSEDSSSESASSGGASGEAKVYAGWYKAVIPAGYEPLFDHEDNWENSANPDQSIRVQISTNKTEEYVKKMVEDKNADKAGSAKQYDDRTYNGVTWKVVGYTMFSDTINSVEFLAEAVDGQMMTVSFEMISIDEPVVDEFMKNFGLADEAKDDPAAAARNWSGN